jgi:hypothetical protein
LEKEDETVQLISRAWGILALLGFTIAFIPCMGALNYLNIPFAVAGLLFSLVAFARGVSGARTASIVGIALCLIAILIGSKRLMWGGFIF